MNPMRITGAVVCVALLSCGVALAADAGPKDVLKEQGLTRSGNAFVVPEEAAVLEGMKSLRTTKAEADKEVRARTTLDLQIAAKRKVMKDSEKTYRELETRLPLVTKVDAHNAIVTRMNRMVADKKQASLALKDLDEQAAKLSSSAKIKYVDELLSLNAKAADGRGEVQGAGRRPRREGGGRQGDRR